MTATHARNLSMLIPLGFSCRDIRREDDKHLLQLQLMDAPRSTIDIRFRAPEDSEGMRMLPVLLENLSHYASARRDSTLARYTQLWLAWYTHAIAAKHERSAIARQAERIGSLDELPEDWRTCLAEIREGRNPFSEGEAA